MLIRIVNFSREMHHFLSPWKLYEKIIYVSMDSRFSSIYLCVECLLWHLKRLPFIWILLVWLYFNPSFFYLNNDLIVCPALYICSTSFVICPHLINELWTVCLPQLTLIKLNRLAPCRHLCPKCFRPLVLLAKEIKFALPPLFMLR